MLHISVDINHFISAPDSRISHSTNCVLYRLAGAKRDIYIHLTFHMELHETTHYATNKQAYVTTTKPTVLCYTQQLQAMKLSLLAYTQRLSTL